MYSGHRNVNCVCMQVAGRRIIYVLKLKYKKISYVHKSQEGESSMYAGCKKVNNVCMQVARR